MPHTVPESQRQHNASNFLPARIRPRRRSRSKHHMGLTPTVHSTYRAVRRAIASCDGECDWPVAALAAWCGISEPQYQRDMRVIFARVLIVKTERPGTAYRNATNLLTLPHLPTPPLGVMNDTQKQVLSTAEDIRHPAGPPPANPVQSKPRTRHIASSSRIARKFCSDRHIPSPWERQRLTQRIEDLLNAGGEEESIVRELDREHREKVERAKVKPHRGTQRRRDAMAARMAADNATLTRQPSPEEIAQREAADRQRNADHLEAVSAALRKSIIAEDACRAAADRVRELDPSDFEALESALTAIEGKLFAEIRAAAPGDLLDGFRKQAVRDMAPYRSGMSAGKLLEVEQQYVTKLLLRHYGLPRLSLFYIDGRTA